MDERSPITKLAGLICDFGKTLVLPRRRNADPSCSFKSKKEELFVNLLLSNQQFLQLTGIARQSHISSLFRDTFLQLCKADSATTTDSRQDAVNVFLSDQTEDNDHKKCQDNDDDATSTISTTISNSNCFDSASFHVPAASSVKLPRTVVECSLVRCSKSSRPLAMPGSRGSSGDKGDLVVDGSSPHKEAGWCSHKLDVPHPSSAFGHPSDCPRSQEAASGCCINIKKAVNTPFHPAACSEMICAVLSTLHLISSLGHKLFTFDESAVVLCCEPVVIDLYCSEWEVVDGASDMLHLVRSRGYRIALCTNSRKGKKQLALIEQKLGDHVRTFDAVATSGVVGHKKPSKEIMQWILNRWEVCGCRVVGMGDLLEKDLECAHRCQVTPIWFPTHAVDFKDRRSNEAYLDDLVQINLEERTVHLTRLSRHFDALTNSSGVSRPIMTEKVYGDRLAPTAAAVIPASISTVATGDPFPLISAPPNPPKIVPSSASVGPFAGAASVSPLFATSDSQCAVATTAISAALAASCCPRRCHASAAINTSSVLSNEECTSSSWSVDTFLGEHFPKHLGRRRRLPADFRVAHLSQVPPFLELFNLVFEVLDKDVTVQTENRCIPRTTPFSLSHSESPASQTTCTSASSLLSTTSSLSSNSSLDAQTNENDDLDNEALCGLWQRAHKVITLKLLRSVLPLVPIPISRTDTSIAGAFKREPGAECSPHTRPIDDLCGSLSTSTTTTPKTTHSHSPSQTIVLRPPVVVAYVLAPAKARRFHVAGLLHSDQRCVFVPLFPHMSLAKQVASLTVVPDLLLFKVSDFLAKVHEPPNRALLRDLCSLCLPDSPRLNGEGNRCDTIVSLDHKNIGSSFLDDIGGDASVECMYTSEEIAEESVQLKCLRSEEASQVGVSLVRDDIARTGSGRIGDIRMSVVTPMYSQRLMVDRFLFFSSLCRVCKSLSLEDPTSPFRVAHFLPFDIPFPPKREIAQRLQQANLRFPLLCKTRLGAGPAEAHHLAVVYNVAGLCAFANGLFGNRESKPSKMEHDSTRIRACVSERDWRLSPVADGVVVQEFIAHDHCVFKVFVMGEHIHVTRHPTLPQPSVLKDTRQECFVGQKSHESARTTSVGMTGKSSAAGGAADVSLRSVSRISSDSGVGTRDLSQLKKNDNKSNNTHLPMLSSELQELEELQKSENQPPESESDSEESAAFVDFDSTFLKRSGGRCASGGNALLSDGPFGAVDDAVHLSRLWGLASKVAAMFGTSLFGIDILVERETSAFVLVDVNFFPSYVEFPNLRERFIELLLSHAAKLPFSQ